MISFYDVIKYFKVYRRYVGRRIYLVFALTVMMALTQGLGFTMLLPLLRVAQSTNGSEELTGAEQVLHNLLAWMGIAQSLVGILTFMVAIFFVKGAIQFAQTSYIGYLQADLLKQLKSDLFSLYNNVKYEYYVTESSGHFINVINAQVRRFFRSFKRFLQTVTKAVSSIIFLGFAFAISWRFALLVSVFGIGILFLFQYLSSYVRKVSRRVSNEMSALNSLLVQSLQAFEYVVATAQVRQMQSRVFDSIQRLTDDIFRQRLAGAVTNSIREPVSVFAISVVIAVQVLVFNGPLTPIFVAIVLFHKGMQSIMAFQKMWQRVMDRIGAVEVVDEEIRRARRHQEQDGSRQLESFADGIELEDVYLSYDGGDSYALRNVDIKIPANRTIALVGKSGAGKTTVMKLLTIMLRPTKGSLRIDGIDHEEIDLYSWRSQIGYVSQESVIFDDTVANNICLWEGDIEDDQALWKRVVEAARRAHADHFIRNLQNEYQTMVGEGGVRLSGGQRQRIFLARELFKTPSLLLLDEATSDLDSASENYIQRSINALKGEMTVVVIAHQLSTVKNADWIYVLEEGKVAEEGTYDKLSRVDGKFSKMVEMQTIGK